MRRFAQLTGMLAFGLAALAVVAWLFEVRTGRPLSDEAQLQAATPMAAFAGACEHSAEHAADALERGDRSEATHALDAAMRALFVGAHARGGDFEEALHAVMKARVHLQRGKKDQAVFAARRAAWSLGAVQATWPDPPAADALGEYEGATVLDLQGLRIGEVHEVLGQEGLLVLQLDGWLDVFGFLDFGANLEGSVPAGAILFGKARTVGGTYVVLPVVRAAPAPRA